jgi:hypothetical protein
LLDRGFDAMRRFVPPEPMPDVFSVFVNTKLAREKNAANYNGGGRAGRHVLPSVA